MKHFNITEICDYVETNISVFHQKRLDYVKSKVDLNEILKQKNPYLFRAKNILTAQDLIKGFLDAFLQSQEETLFGQFIEGFAIYVCDKVYGAKKSELIGIDLEFEKDNCIYIVEIKAGWNWGNASQIKQLKINFENAKKQLQKTTKKQIIAVNGCCFGKNKKPDKQGYFKYCGQQFWELISGNDNLYIEIIEPIGHKAKQKNEEFLRAYSQIVNKLTLEFSQRFCKDGIINWEELIKFNSSDEWLSSVPFHTRLLGKDRMVLFSFIHSLNTNFGTSIFEPIPLALASSNFAGAALQQKAGTN